MGLPSTPPMGSIQPYKYKDPEEYEMHMQTTLYEHDTHYPRTVYHTPPQAIKNNGIQTRSGRSIGTPVGSSSPGSRLSQSPRRRKPKKGKDKALEAKIQEPLSVMTKDYDVPVDDMVKWVHRPHEERWKEVKEKHRDRVPRPMNSFMLYRRAYKERIKKWGAQGDNNQMISSVAGLSWNIESQKIQDFYKKMAAIEKDNHTKAFPLYKFKPNKKTRKHGREDDDDDDDDDSDPEWDGGSTYSFNPRKRGRHGRDVTRSRSTTPVPMMYASPLYHPSSYQASNPHLMHIPQYGQWAQPLTYDMGYHYDQTVYSQYPPDLDCAPTSAAMHHEMYGSNLAGLPPTSANMLERDVMSHAEFAIDPELGEYTPAANYQYGGFNQEDEHSAQGFPREYCDVVQQVEHPGLQTLAPAEQWSPTHQVGSAFDAELNHWH